MKTPANIQSFNKNAWQDLTKLKKGGILGEDFPYHNNNNTVNELQGNSGYISSEEVENYICLPDPIIYNTGYINDCHTKVLWRETSCFPEPSEWHKVKS